MPMWVSLKPFASEGYSLPYEKLGTNFRKAVLSEPSRRSFGPIGQNDIGPSPLNRD